MSLRLVLISLVAGLGIGLPSWPTVEGWVAGAQKWMNARLAAADDRGGERRVIIHDLLAAEMQRAHAARVAQRAAANPPHAPRPAILAVAHSTAPRRPAAAAITPPPAFLPKLDDYLTAATTAPVAAVPAVSAVRPDDLALLAWNRLRPEGARLADSLAAGLREAAERDRDARAFLAMEETHDLYFDAAVEPEPAPLPAVAAAPAPAPAAEPEPVALEGPMPVAIAPLPVAAAPLPDPAPLPGFEEMEKAADLYFAPSGPDAASPAPEAMLAETPEPAAPAPAAVVAAAEPALAELPADVFAPDEPAIEAIAAVEPTPAPAAPEVNRAVHLTREALSAWINVLTGPALVTAAHGASVTR